MTIEDFKLGYQMTIRCCNTETVFSILSVKLDLRKDRAILGGVKTESVPSTFRETKPSWDWIGNGSTVIVDYDGFDVTDVEYTDLSEVDPGTV